MPINIKNFLFRNTGIRQTVLKNTFWLTAAEIIAKASGLVLVIFIARMLGAQEYGKFIFALSFVSVLSIFSDLGVMDISTREFSRSAENEKKFPGIFTLELFLCLAAFFIIWIGSFFIARDPGTRWLILILAFFVLSNSVFGVIFAFLRARQKMEYEAVVKVMQAVANVGFVFLAMLFSASPQGAAYGYLISNILVLGVTLVFFHIKFHKVSLRWSMEAWHILKISWPLSFGFMAGWLYLSMNSVVLGYFGMDRENGWYGVASKIAMVSIISANLIIKSFYPLLSKFFVESREKLQKSFDYFARAMVVLAFPLVAGTWALSPKIIPLFYGNAFAPAIPALQMLMIVIGISFLSYPYTIMLVVADKQKNNFFLIVAGAVFSLALDLLLIPAYGFYGAIYSSILSCSVFFLCTVFLSHYYRLITVVDRKLLQAILFSAIASGVMGFLVSMPLTNRVSVILLAPLGLAVYAGFLWLLYWMGGSKKFSF